MDLQPKVPRARKRHEKVPAKGKKDRKAAAQELIQAEEMLSAKEMLSAQGMSPT